MTGGGQGLGEGIARMLCDNGAAKVVIFDFDEDKGQKVASSLKESRGLFCKVDVSNEESVKAGFQKVRDECGRLDIMVNSAGIVGPNGLKVEDVETAKFDKVYEGSYVPLHTQYNSTYTYPLACSAI